MEVANTSIYIFADSRGKHLDRLLAPLVHTPVIVYFYSGAKISRLTDIICDHKFPNPPTHIYMFAGICDCTTKDRTKRTIHLANNNLTELIDNIQATIRDNITKISCALPKVHVIMCPIIGQHLATVNKHSPHGENISAQTTLDNAIMEINRYITGLNASNHLPTPWTSTVIHHRQGGRITHHYDRLFDGRHLDDQANQLLARKFAANINKL